MVSVICFCDWCVFMSRVDSGVRSVVMVRISSGVGVDLLLRVCEIVVISVVMEDMVVVWMSCSCWVFIW